MVIDILIALGLILIAVFGAVVKWLNATPGEWRLTIAALIAQGSAAALAGALMIAIYFNLHWNVAVCMMLSAALGIGGLEVLKGFLKATLGNMGVKWEEKVPPEERESEEG